jgi:hypothetical protein
MWDVCTSLGACVAVVPDGGDAVSCQPSWSTALAMQSEDQGVLNTLYISCTYLLLVQDLLPDHCCCMLSLLVCWHCHTALAALGGFLSFARSLHLYTREQDR